MLCDCCGILKIQKVIMDKDKPEIYDWTLNCRICLSPEADIVLMDDNGLFNEKKLKKIRQFFKSNIIINEHMPRMVCKSCYDKILDWTEMKKKCVQTEDYVLKRLKVYDLKEDSNSLEEDMNKCDKCDGEFLFKGDFKNHVCIPYKGVEENICFHCGGQFLDKEELEIHRNMVRKNFSTSSSEGDIEINGVCNDTLTTCEKASYPLRQKKEITVLSEKDNSELNFTVKHKIVHPDVEKEMRNVLIELDVKQMISAKDSLKLREIINAGEQSISDFIFLVVESVLSKK